MSGDVGYGLAFAAGVVSFASPCVLPLVPAYLSLITGLDVADLAGATGPRSLRIARDTGLFIVGFGVVFVALGLSATALGSALTSHQQLLTRLSGLVVMSMGLFVLGSLFLRAPWLYRELRFHPNLGRLGHLAAPVAGAAFGFGWTPCIGPVLGSVLTLAATGGNASHAAALMGGYTLGLGLPFLATGLAFGRLTGAVALVRRHVAAVTVVSATTLTLFGALIAVDRLTMVTTGLQSALNAIGLGRLVTVG